MKRFKNLTPSIQVAHNTFQAEIALLLLVILVVKVTFVGQKCSLRPIIQKSCYLHFEHRVDWAPPT